MTQYLTYEQYTSYGGTVEQTTFDDLEFEARSIIDWYTFNRLQGETEFPEAVTRCMYRLIQFIQLRAAASTLPTEDGTSVTGGIAGIASQSNDGVSISYNVMSAKDILESSSTEMEQLIQRYLQGVKNSLGRKLLYRGFYPDE